mmetsp:Transcript_17932/g.12919  ORF Transcript_17932/g.12919 Transcript_17932/m.12919 type:complete len:137 (+) Transcript_17932:391-801(+)
MKKLKQLEQEEMQDHQKDIEALKQIILSNQVDLIVVGAHKLDSRKIYNTIKEVASSLKDLAAAEEQHEANEEAPRKEAIVIWGSLEIPRLFSVSHQSQKLLKNCNTIIKQCVSLARFAQDPLPEVLNLWSSIPSEN